MGLKSIRLQHGLSQEKLAELSNLSLRTIQRIEKDNKASIESINALCNVFNMEFKTLKENIEKEHIKQVNSTTNTTKVFQDKKIQSFLIINTLLFLINIIITPEYLWFIYPLVGWGIPLFYRRYFRKKEEILT